MPFINRNHVLFNMKIAILGILFFHASITFSFVGNFRLNSFPEEDHFYSLKITVENDHTQNERIVFETNRVESNSRIFTMLYGRKINNKSFYSVSIPYINKHEDEFELGNVTGRDYSSSSLQEPTVNYHYRLKKSIKEGDRIKDLSFSFTPSLMEKETGTSGNNAVGRSRLQLGYSFGEIYTKWEAHFAAFYTLNGKGKEKFTSSGITYARDRNEELLFTMGFQFAYSDRIYFECGSGLKLVTDTKINSDASSGKGKIIEQRGTGSPIHLAGIYKNKDASFYKLKLSRMRNEYFIKTNNNNYEGGFTRISIDLEYLKGF